MDINIKPLELAVDTAKQFIQSVITPPLEEVGGIFADTIKYYRFYNQINIAVKAENLIKKKRITTKKVSIKAIAPLLEESSWEEDENLQQMWATLLANTVDVNSVIKTNIFISILKEMTTDDAEVFKAIFEHCMSGAEVKDGIHVFHRATHPKAFEGVPGIDLIFDNLKRLRLVREISTHGSSQVPVVLSELGVQFWRSCNI